MPITFNQPQHNYFPYAAPFPEKSCRFDLVEQKPVKEFVLNGKVVKARLIDFMDYQLKSISDYHALWAYGVTGKELAGQLLERWPQLKPESRIVIYLFEKVTN